MQAISHVRPHLTSSQRDKILQAYRRSPLTQKEFAAQVGIGVSTLHAWLRKCDAKPAASGFLPVPNLLAVTPSAPTYHIQWPSGLSLEVRSGFADQELAVVLHALQTL